MKYLLSSTPSLGAWKYDQNAKCSEIANGKRWFQNILIHYSIWDGKAQVCHGENVICGDSAEVFRYNSENVSSYVVVLV